MIAEEPGTASSFDAVLASQDEVGRVTVLSISARRDAVTAGTAQALAVLSTRDEGEHDTPSRMLCHDHYSDLYDAAS